MGFTVFSFCNAILDKESHSSQDEGILSQLYQECQMIYLKSRCEFSMVWEKVLWDSTHVFQKNGIPHSYLKFSSLNTVEHIASSLQSQILAWDWLRNPYIKEITWVTSCLF